jgi:PIN domain nuclease of toxin-antitoxin system
MIVADTHVIIWDALKLERLSLRARKTITDANNGDGIIFCDISLWEIAMLVHKGRLSVGIGYLQFITLNSAMQTHRRWDSIGACPVKFMLMKDEVYFTGVSKIRGLPN